MYSFTTIVVLSMCTAILDYCRLLVFRRYSNTTAVKILTWGSPLARSSMAWNGYLSHVFSNAFSASCALSFVTYLALGFCLDYLPRIHLSPIALVQYREHYVSSVVRDGLLRICDFIGHTTNLHGLPMNFLVHFEGTTTNFAHTQWFPVPPNGRINGTILAADVPGQLVYWILNMKLDYSKFLGANYTLFHTIPHYAELFVNSAALSVLAVVALHEVLEWAKFWKKSQEKATGNVSEQGRLLGKRKRGD